MYKCEQVVSRVVVTRQVAQISIIYTTTTGFTRHAVSQSPARHCNPRSRSGSSPHSASLPPATGAPTRPIAAPRALLFSAHAQVTPCEC